MKIKRDKDKRGDAPTDALIWIIIGVIVLAIALLIAFNGKDFLSGFKSIFGKLRFGI